VDTKYGTIFFFQVLKCKCNKLPVTAAGKVMYYGSFDWKMSQKRSNLVTFQVS